MIIGAFTSNMQHHFDGHEVAIRRRREAGLDDVHAQLHQLPCDVELLLCCHGGSRGLFAVAEGGVQDADVGGVGDVVGNVLRAEMREFWGLRTWSGGFGCH